MPILCKLFYFQTSAAVGINYLTVTFVSSALPEMTELLCGLNSPFKEPPHWKRNLKTEATTYNCYNARTEVIEVPWAICWVFVLRREETVKRNAGSLFFCHSLPYQPLTNSWGSNPISTVESCSLSVV